MICTLRNVSDLYFYEFLRRKRKKKGKNQNLMNRLMNRLNKILKSKILADIILIFMRI